MRSCTALGLSAIHPGFRCYGSMGCRDDDGSADTCTQAEAWTRDARGRQVAGWLGSSRTCWASRRLSPAQWSQEGRDILSSAPFPPGSSPGITSQCQNEKTIQTGWGTKQEPGCCQVLCVTRSAQLLLSPRSQSSPADHPWKAGAFHSEANKTHSFFFFNSLW